MQEIKAAESLLSWLSLGSLGLGPAPSPAFQGFDWGLGAVALYASDYVSVRWTGRGAERKENGERRDSSAPLHTAQPLSAEASSCRSTPRSTPST